MCDDLKIKVYAFTLDCKEPHELAKFYRASRLSAACMACYINLRSSKNIPAIHPVFIIKDHKLLLCFGG